ncbi:hydrolase 2, exosortase A system-associated [Massilia horti]|uniref:Hydrolase 2, exosortase A system-associated n=1 Tax=Massilia horti TaxID=2562153 RepID=A0A4Y9SYN2_9BURK|nr:hydrolase 2, exosortase A system-associated [Massilia horti]TFW30667.1 hydrolase 2, exosortase A system-associated [Massilia horti]
MTQLPASPRALPFFLDSAPGQRFCLYHPPAGECRGAVLYVHPFAEEMNKARRMAALQARALAALGYGVLLLDLHGCGDSSDDFGDARWEAWRRDVALGCDWLREQTGHTPSLWGLRLGALLALDHAHHAAPGSLERVVLWQPVPSGALHLTQFLRLRVAGEMLDEGKEKSGGTEALRAALKAGETLEIGGYGLAPQLAASLEQLDAAALPVTGCPLHWLEIVASPERPLPPACTRVTRAWEQAGLEVRVHLVPGQAFWATQEITECPALLEATCAIFGGSA